MSEHINWSKAKTASSKVLEKKGDEVVEQTKLFNIDCSLSLFKTFSISAIRMHIDKQLLFERTVLAVLSHSVSGSVINQYKGCREKKTSVRLKQGTIDSIKEYCLMNDIKIIDFNCYILSNIK